MKARIISGKSIAVAAVALALTGATPVAAKQKPHHSKPKAEKSGCGGKNGCGAKQDKSTEATTTKAPGDAKPAEAK